MSVFISRVPGLWPAGPKRPSIAFRGQKGADLPAGGVVGAPSFSPPARRDLAMAVLDGTVWQPPQGLLWHQKDKLNKHVRLLKHLFFKLAAAFLYYSMWLCCWGTL